MKRGLYPYFGGALLLLFFMIEAGGYELATSVAKGSVPPGARNASGFRSYSYWNGGK